MMTKKYFGTAGFSSDGLPCIFKPPESNTFPSFPAKCGAPLADVLDTTHPKPNAAAGRKVELSSNGKISRCPDRAKCEVAIPAVPLTSLPIDVKWKPEESVSSHDNNHEGQKKWPCNIVQQKEDSWKHEVEKLEAVIAQAKEFIGLLDAKYSTCNTIPFPAAEDTFKDCGESKDQHTSFDQSLSRKRLKVSSGISVAVQEGNASGTETMSEDEVSFLSPAEWKASQHHKDEPVKPQGVINIVDCIDPVTVATKADQPSELTLTKCRDQHWGNGSTDSDESEGEQYDAFKTFFDDDEASATYLMNCKKEYELCEDHNELINLEIVQHDHPRGRKAMEALKLFKEEYIKLCRELDPREGKSSRGPHLVAAQCVKAKGMNFSPDKPFGHIPGIEIGDEFSFRAELTVVGLNCQFTPGIDYVNVDGEPYATCVVNSGRYENKAKEHDILIYSGQGGNPNLYGNDATDQKLERGNLALFNNIKMGFPVRVVHKRKLAKCEFVYVYDGLYKVNRYWHEREQQNHKLVYQFELQRLPGQVRNHRTDVRGRKRGSATDICVLDDISQGKEKFKVRAVNGVDDDHPPPFTYMTNIVYLRCYSHKEPVGCDCVNGCSDSVLCPCVEKNGGEIPYTEKGKLMIAKTDRIVHECGPSCKCPPSCMNRVSQGGLQFQLEIFKTKSMGWGVRSRNYIMPGSFICEYIGELLDENEADKRIGKDEYLFDICHGKSQEDDFALDAANCGNVGRFINHSCDPNVFAQKVSYDHDDERMPHIMFFAGKRIIPGQQLMYDYNYTKVRVCDANGNIKSKACHCGSRKCKGKLY